ncbi:MAG TPA: hypothetical protein DEV72_04585 [Ktedonobacter sp.]|jgi:hypothetical protein|nr:hypothetical protein [Ktedonobacter sp.]HCF84461.1 hypothetical protein [Ktedonobacter sp.]
MDNDALIQASRKKPSGKVIVVALLGIHGIFLIIIGLIAFFGGFVGVYDVSNGHATPGAIVAVLGTFLAWIFLLEGIVSFLCAQGLWTRQRWAFWLTIALEVTNLIVGGCALMLQLFAPWPIALSMSVAGGVLLSVLIVIGPRTLSHR